MDPSIEALVRGSFVERHEWVVEAALALAAAMIGVGGFFALPRRA